MRPSTRNGVRITAWSSSRAISLSSAHSVTITTASVAAARDGATQLFALLAFLSINLAVMNLLPIPILDGGQIVMNIAEAVKGSPFSMRTRENIMRVGLLAIGLLFVVVTFNDLRRLAGVARDFLTRVF